MAKDRFTVLLAFGTRPEAIKMAPVIHSLSAEARLKLVVMVSGQHREMLNQVLGLFEISPDYDLDIMRKKQNLFDVTSGVLSGVGEVLDEVCPDLILVHGDTSTSFASALAAFYKNTPVGHVEAGLRTFDLSSPFPEEANRQLTSRITKWHYAPTRTNLDNLVSEGVPRSNIIVTGNTVIDALLWMRDRLLRSEDFRHKANIELADAGLDLAVCSQKYVLITGHRRENFGEGFKNICSAVLALSQQFPDVHFIYPVHLNPHVQGPVTELLDNIRNIHLLSPVSYAPFVWLMMNSYLILTDSGGIQEEGPSLGKPVLVMRDTTERPEAVEAGTVKLVGTSVEKITDGVSELLKFDAQYSKAARSHNPYGDGTASSQIRDHILSLIN